MIQLIGYVEKNELDQEQNPRAPQTGGQQGVRVVPTFTECVLSDSYDLNQSSARSLIPLCVLGLSRTIVWSMVLNAAERSRRLMSVTDSLAILRRSF